MNDNRKKPVDYDDKNENDSKEYPVDILEFDSNTAEAYGVKNENKVNNC